MCCPILGLLTGDGSSPCPPILRAPFSGCISLHSSRRGCTQPLGAELIATVTWWVLLPVWGSFKVCRKSSDVGSKLWPEVSRVPLGALPAPPMIRPGLRALEERSFLPSTLFPFAACAASHLGLPCCGGCFS